MCFPLFNSLISNHKIAFAIPRIDICNDIYNRLTEYYPSRLIGIRTGCKQVNLDANLLVLTTNQLLKYKAYFQLIIIDEVDAFPFDFDPLYYEGVTASRTGPIFYLTSTPSKRLTTLNLPTFTIYKRWHNKPLPVPKLIHHKSFDSFPRSLTNLITNRKRKLLIFISTIYKGKKFSETLSSKAINHQFVYSTNPKRSQIIDDFRNDKFQILLTTTILERGVTFDDIDVLVVDSDDQFYTKAALVQIAGRVNRKLEHQQGAVYFRYVTYTKTIHQSIKFIKGNNKKI